MSRKQKPPVWIQIFFSPQEAFARILEKSMKRGMWQLSLIQGLLFLSMLAMFYSYGRFFPIWILLLGVTLLSPYFGHVVLFCFSYLVHGVGLWMGAKGGIERIKCIVRWSQLPLVGALVVESIFLLIFQDRFFLMVKGGFQGVELYIYRLFLSFVVIAYLWSFYILIEGLHLVQHIGKKRVVIGVVLSLTFFLLVLYLVNLPFLSRCNYFFTSYPFQ